MARTAGDAARSAYGVRGASELPAGHLGHRAVFETLEENIFAHPSDLEAVGVYLEALQPGERPLAWLPTVVKPTQGDDILSLAQWLGTRAPREALAVLGRAPATLRDEDTRRIRTMT